MFVTLVGLWVAGRIGFLSAVVMVPDCLALQPALLGQGGRIDAVLDTLGLAGMAALGVIAATGLIGWHQKTLNWGAAAFGTVNAGMAGLLIAQWVVGWSFFNPDSGLAKAVMPLGPQVRTLSVEYSAEGRSPFEGMPGWKTIGPRAYFNAELGIFAREEPVRRCFTPAFVRQNRLNASLTGLASGGAHIASTPDFGLDRSVYAWIYYDRDSQYLTSDIYPHHDRFADLQKRDAEREARRRRVDPAGVLAQVDASLMGPPGEEASERPYTLDEIEAMVREAWDRDAPVP